ncbi:beta-phosphoglucomutase [Erysipelothrix larvae]|uniref:Beta-phosphoglucomutase n=1 Tax=Erysipelothrix larvae TaxID=1514105 RepID=A0A0X8H1T5_9FIRM|nr:beta-phosphoglucomutase [Erysipelothrix larvae]AMC94496.1 beta-phosphoglucomutase [Erysipelothrix larvae]
MKYKAVIFDLDGVICSTDEYHFIAWKQIADDLDVHFDESINNRLRGISRMESLDIILKKNEVVLSLEEKELIADKKNKIYIELLKQIDKSNLSPEVSETIESLSAKGVMLAIGSSSKNAKFILKQLGIMNSFSVICDGTDITYSKPNPEVFTKAAQRLGVNVSECLVVEDAVAGIDAALDGGIDCAGIGEAASYCKTTYKLSSIKDILKILF